MAQSNYWQNQIQATRAASQTRGDQIANQLDADQNQYQYETQQDTQNVSEALSNLQQTPGYTGDEASAIEGQAGLDALGNVDYNANFFTPGQQQQISGDPYQAYQAFNAGSTEGVVSSNEQNYNAANAIGAQNLGSATSNAQQGITGAVADNAQALTDTGAYSNDLDQVMTTTSNNEYGAIDPSKLSTSPDYNQNYKFSDEDAQNLVTAAGTTVGQQTQAQNDQAMRQAIAEGNTSPAALAAIQQENNLNGAAQAGDAMTSARNTAKATQLATEQQKEQTQLGAQQFISGSEVGAAQSLGNLADTAVQQREQTELGSEQFLTNEEMAAQQASGQLGTSAAEYEQSQDAQQQQFTAAQALGANEYEQNTATGLISSGENAASSRAAALAQNQQQTNELNQQNQFTWGNTINQEESQRAGTVANARIAGNNSYLAGAEAQQGQAQAGATGTAGQQISEYGTEYDNLNKAQSNGAIVGMFEQQQPSFWGEAAGAALGAAAAFEDGGVVNGDDTNVLGSTGPQSTASPTPSFWSKLKSGINAYRTANSNGAAPNAPIGGQQLGQQQTKPPQQQGGFFGGLNQGLQTGNAIGKMFKPQQSQQDSAQPQMGPPAMMGPPPLGDNPGAGDFGAETDAPASLAGGLGSFSEMAPDMADDAAMAFAADGDPGTDDGGQTALIGEDGPEMVVPEDNPAAGQLVTQPTIAKLGQGGKKDMVVPLTPRRGANVRPSAALPAIHSYRARALAHHPHTHMRRFDDGGVAQPWGPGENMSPQPPQQTMMNRYRQAPQQPQPGGVMGTAQPQSGSQMSPVTPTAAGSTPAGSAPGAPVTAQQRPQMGQPRGQMGGQMNRYRQPLRPPMQQAPPQAPPQQPQQPQTFADGGVAGLNAAMKARYRRPTGPVGPHGPIRPLIPLKPSQTFR